MHEYVQGLTLAEYPCAATLAPMPHPSPPALRFGAMTLLACVATAGPLAAQCPDGTPPPCTRSSIRRAVPTLDPRKWIVLPFENLSGSSDAEWLRAASANMLYLDLSQWTDVHVVDDERVADMMRATPETRDVRPVSLTASRRARQLPGRRDRVAAVEVASAAHRLSPAH